MKIELTGDPLLILDFDIEARPLSWYGGDWVTKEVTAIACQFIGVGPVLSWTLTKNPGSARRMLKAFVEKYKMADMVTGHFIRGYDLPVLNGALAEHGLPLLEDKLTHDTKFDLVKLSGLSKSQENLGAMLGLENPKVGMNQAMWRDANRLTPEGIALTKERVEGDVIQHVEMRQRLLDLGLLGAPKVWTGSPSGVGKYAP